MPTQKRRCGTRHAEEAQARLGPAQAVVADAAAAMSSLAASGAGDVVVVMEALLARAPTCNRHADATHFLKTTRAAESRLTAALMRSCQPCWALGRHALSAPRRHAHPDMRLVLDHPRVDAGALLRAGGMMRMARAGHAVGIKMHT
jgi:hypothetical protein